MKSLIIFYSSNGSCNKISMELKKLLEVNNFKVSLTEIKPKVKLREFEYQKLERIEFLNKEKDFDLKDYDLIFIGSSVWSYNLSPVTKTFLRKLKNVKGKKFVLFCSCVLPGNSLKRMSGIISTSAGYVLKTKAFQSIFEFSNKRLNEVEELLSEVLAIINFKPKKKVKNKKIKSSRFSFSFKFKKH